MSIGDMHKDALTSKESGFLGRIDALNARISKLEAALKWYATQSNWNFFLAELSHVQTTKYDGGFYLFDRGNLKDDEAPWEIAQEALKK